ncbi:MAG: hypothetical protein K0S28_1870 [Paucimonas sp.]|jgi:hypothetical protein|nr:hypothetical protein [Paucimonas sp.]
MDYIDIKWRHDFDDKPVRLVCELDVGRYETRKLEFFRNGSVGFAEAGRHTVKTALALRRVPPLESLNEKPEFEGVAITASEFDLLWSKYVAQYF